LEQNTDIRQFHHKEGGLSILESKNPEDVSDDVLRTTPSSLFNLRSRQTVPLLPTDIFETPQSRESADAEPCLQDEWGVYIERDWDPVIKGFFYACLYAVVCRIIDLKYPDFHATKKLIILPFVSIFSFVFIATAMFLDTSLPPTKLAADGKSPIDDDLQMDAGPLAYRESLSDDVHSDAESYSAAMPDYLNLSLLDEKSPLDDVHSDEESWLSAMPDFLDSSFLDEH
jgi:hypothetical protein